MSVTSFEHRLTYINVIFSHRNDVKRDEKNVAKRNDDRDHEIQNHEIKMFQLMISRPLLKVQDFIL